MGQKGAPQQPRKFPASAVPSATITLEETKMTGFSVIPQNYITSLTFAKIQKQTMKVTLLRKQLTKINEY